MQISQKKELKIADIVKIREGHFKGSIGIVIKTIPSPWADYDYAEAVIHPLYINPESPKDWWRYLYYQRCLLKIND